MSASPPCLEAHRTIGCFWSCNSKCNSNSGHLRHSRAGTSNSFRAESRRRGEQYNIRKGDLLRNDARGAAIARNTVTSGPITPKCSCSCSCPLSAPPRPRVKTVRDTRFVVQGSQLAFAVAVPQKYESQNANRCTHPAQRPPCARASVRELFAVRCSLLACRDR